MEINATLNDKRIDPKQHLQLPPPDGNPYSGKVQPGESIALAGDITFKNLTDQELDLRVVFELPGGFQLFINGEKVGKAKMHGNYLVKKNDDGFELQTFSPKTKKWLTRMGQKA